MHEQPFLLHLFDKLVSATESFFSIFAAKCQSLLRKKGNPQAINNKKIQ